MAGHAVEHDYHLIPPSKWPFLAGISCFVWIVGMLTFFTGLVPRTGQNSISEFFFAKGLDFVQAKAGAEKFAGQDVSNGGWIILLIGCTMAAYVMYGWWRDVVHEGEAGDHTPVVEIGLRYGMIMFIMQEAMFFVGWFWMFFEVGLFNEARAAWDTNILENAAAYKDSISPMTTEPVSPWHLPLRNTLILLLSGTTVTWAHHALIKGDRKSAKTGLALTVLLGIFFTALQYIEYAEAFAHRGHGAPWLSHDAYGSAFFLATGFHGLHVLIGTIFLFVCYMMLRNGKFTPKKHFGFEAAAWYWHFVDVVWLFLFAFVYIVFGMKL